MAYAEHTISDMSEIPALALAFASDLGWIVSGSTMRHPNYEGAGPGGLTFTCEHALGTGVAPGLPPVLNRIMWSCDGPGNSAFAAQPRFSTVEEPAGIFPQAPTKLFLIGMMTPEPYVAMVIEFGYNLYRHLYAGFMEKIGDYSGGEVISGHNCPVKAYNGSLLWCDSAATHGMFRGQKSDVALRADNGGVHCPHADNAADWRSFMSAAYHNNTMDNLYDGLEAVGGFGDGLNDMHVARGLNPISGVAVLAPINLYATQKVLGDVRFRPLGRPAGVRLINIANLPAQAETTISTETWHSFAATSKRDTAADMPSAYAGFESGLRLFESSYHLGYAYRSE